jgi:NAD(P)-dependent dehydrogenase (short-subunit alcohol dehydrogenase family)
MPDQSGRTIIVTGANSGLGFQTALELARHGAHVVMTVRDESKVEPQKPVSKPSVSAARSNCASSILPISTM